MNISTEKRLQELENEIKALKSTYTISGGSMKTYISYSDVYNTNYTEHPLRVKFTPLFGEGDILVTSFFVEQNTTEGNPSYNLSQWSVIEEQNSDGTVTFEIPLMIFVTSVRVGIASTVPGTFTRI